MKVTIVTNNKGEGDYFYILLDEKIVEQGHSLNLFHWKVLLNTIKGYTEVEYQDLNDEDFNEWQDKHFH